MPSVRRLDVATFDPRQLRDTPDGREWLLRNGLKSEEYIARRKKHDQEKPSKSSSGPFVGWDGEGMTIDGSHKYVLLANSYGHSITNTSGIPTVEALHFLCDEAKEDRRANHVCFGASYDVNMILADLGSHHVTMLVWNGIIHWGDFRIEYRPRKELQVSRYKGRHLTRNRDVTITLWDVIGFFQCSFVKALEKWLGETDPEVVAEVAAMKLRRNIFTPDEMERVTAYCFSECALLVKLMDQLRRKMRPVQLIPTRWDGAGAIGGKLLQNHRVNDYRGGPLPKEVQRASQYAYFGGRIECVQYGNYEHEVWTHDIRSAYPYAMTQLPCLAHGEWQQGESGPFALYHVRWNLPGLSTRFNPLPWRNKDGAVYFPSEGEGWYWTPEYELLSDYLPEDAYEVLDSWSWDQSCRHTPFSFIQDVYTQRQRMRAAGHDAHIVLKLALNSMYGKLAQKVGWNREKKCGPKYHQLQWAGYITSLTRANLFHLAMVAPEDVIAFETDGLFSRSLHPCVQSEELGAWEVERHEGITYCQSGMYWLCDNNKWWSKSRGLMRDVPESHSAFALTRDRVLGAWKEGIWQVEVVESRFRTMASAVVSLERFTEWRQWRNDRKVVTTVPRGKRMVLPVELDRSTWAIPGLHRTIAAGGGGLSAPHLIPWVDGVGSGYPAEVEAMLEREADGEDMEYLTL